MVVLHCCVLVSDFQGSGVVLQYVVLLHRCRPSMFVCMRLVKNRAGLDR